MSSSSTTESDTVDLTCGGEECDPNACGEDDPCPAGQICASGHCTPLEPIETCERQPMSMSEVAIAGYPSALALADVDGDSLLDMVVVLPAEGVVEVMLGDGAGGFGTGTTFPTGLSPGAPQLVVTDLNGDGRPDLVLASPTTVGELSLMVNQGGTFAAPFVSTIGQRPEQVFAGDFDGDGDADVLVRSVVVEGELSLRPGDGMGGVGPEQVFDLPGDLVFAIGAGAVAGDERLDVVSTESDPPGANILNITGDALSTIGSAPGDGEVDYLELAVGDLDGEGPDDFVLLRATSPLRLVRTWSQLVAAEEFALPWAVDIAKIGDVDGDGRGDVVGAALEWPLAVIYLDTPCVQGYPLPGATHPHAMAVGDVDGDGKADVVAAAIGFQTVGILRTGP